MTSYFGPMTVLDDQSSFESSFGRNPELFSSNLSLKDNDTRKKLYSYAENCMFDVFLAIVRHDYVGTLDVVSETKMIHDTCKKLSALRMAYKLPNSNRMHLDTPDDLFSKFLGTVAGLPDDASKWSLPLFTTYFSALVVLLQDKMEEDKFEMPLHSGLITKKLQVVSLCKV